MRQQQYQIDVRSVEELFGQQEEAATGLRETTPATGTLSRVSRSRSFKESGKDEVSVTSLKTDTNNRKFVLTATKNNEDIVEYCADSNYTPMSGRSLFMQDLTVQHALTE